MDYAQDFPENEHEVDHSEASREVPVPDLSNVSLDLDFSLLSKQMTIGEVSMISAGYIFDSTIDLDGVIDVAIGGAVVGKGRLIQVGEKVGIQIVRWNASGL